MPPCTHAHKLTTKHDVITGTFRIDMNNVSSAVVDYHKTFRHDRNKGTGVIPFTGKARVGSITKHICFKERE